MTYEDAEQCFDENRRLIGNPTTREDALIWNISTGLSHLTSALRSDLQQIEHLLHQVQQRLRP